MLRRERAAAAKMRAALNHYTRLRHAPTLRAIRCAAWRDAFETRIKECRQR